VSRLSIENVNGLLPAALAMFSVSVAVSFAATVNENEVGVNYAAGSLPPPPVVTL
jgi:hypothetical protein